MQRATTQKLLQMDRRWIFLMVFVSILVARLIPFDLPIEAGPNVRTMADTIREVGEKGGRLLISFDYEPGTAPELDPMSRAIMRHAFKNGAKVVGVTLAQNGQDLAERNMRFVAEEYGKEYGTEWAFLGYKPGFVTVMIGMGQDFYSTFSKDSEGRDIRSIPLTRDVHSLSDFDYVVTVTSNKACEDYVIYTVEKYKYTLGCGVTGVIAPDIFPFIQTGQVNGFLGGLAGAAEFENYVGETDRAAVGMRPQSAVHALLVLFVLFGNLLFFLDRYLARRDRLRGQA